MKYSLVADIMFVAVGEKGPIWPDTDTTIEAMEFAKKNGLDRIEIFDWETRDIDRLAEKSEELGVHVEDFCAAAGELLGVPGREDEVLEGFKRSIPAAEKLGTKKLILNANGFDREASHEAVYNSMVKALKLIAPEAEKAGITAIVEPVTGGWFSGTKEIFPIIDEVGSDSVKVLYDCFHMQNMEGNITNTLKENLDKIGHIHGAGAPARCEISAGELNYSFILDTLKELGYEGCFGLEFFTFGGREQKVADSVKVLGI